jgi:hypothetical protein
VSRFGALTFYAIRTTPQPSSSSPIVRSEGVRGMILPILIWPHAALAAGAVEPDQRETAGASEVRPSAERPSEPAAPSELSLDAGVGLISRGLWRGLTLGTPAVLETSASVGYQSVSVGIVSSAFVGPHVRPGGQMAGFDMNVAYDFSAGPLVVTPALNVFSYPGAGQTSEVSSSVSLDLGALGSSSDPEGHDLGNLGLRTQQAIDIMSNRGGWYAEGGLAWSKKLGWTLTLDLDLSISCYSGSFARYYVDESITGVRVGATALGSALTYPAADWLSLTLQAATSALLDPDLRRSVGSDAQLYAGGLAVGVAN